MPPHKKLDGIGKKPKYLRKTPIIFPTPLLVAWFQAKSSGADPRHEVTAGSSNITLGNVKAYRFSNSKLDDSGTKSYTDGAVAEYNTNKAAASNPHQDSTANDISTDIPSDGVGYYLVGDSNFAADAFGNGSLAWTYGASSKMKTTDIGAGNKAAIFHVYIAAHTWRFEIRHHYYQSDNAETKNDVVTLTNEYDKAARYQVESTYKRFGVKSAGFSAGFYNIFLNSSDGISIAADGSSPLPRAAVRPGGRTDAPAPKGAAVSAGKMRLYWTSSSVTGWSGFSGPFAGKTSYTVTLSGSITASGSIPASGNTSVTSWSKVGDIDIGSQGYCKFTFFQNDDRWVPWRSGQPYQRNGEGYDWQASTNALLLNDDGTTNFTNGTIYQIGYSSWKAEYNRFTDLDYSNATRKIQWFNYSLSVAGYFVHYQGEGVSSSHVEGKAGSNAYTTKAAPTRQGYTFKYWKNVATNETVGAATATTLTAETTFEAVWEANSYDITLNTNSGMINSGNVTSYTYGVGATLPTDVTRSGYQFIGWSATNALNAAKVTSISSSEYGDKTFYAQWVNLSNAPDMYVLISRDSWSSNIYVYIWGSENAVSYTYHLQLNDGNHTSADYTNVYTFKLPTTAGGFLLYNNSSASIPTDDSASTKHNKTRNLIIDEGSDTPGVTNSVSDYSPSYNMVTVQDANEGSAGGFVDRSYVRWGRYEAPPAKRGYYLVGGSATLTDFEDYTWNTSGSVVKMEHERIGDNKAELLEHAFSTADAYYQIWEYTGSEWHQYAAQATGSVGAVASCNFQLSGSATGIYDLYLNSSKEIYLGSNYEAKINFSIYQGSASSQSFLMRHGDKPDGSTPGINRFVYEEPITVSAGDKFTISYQKGNSTSPVTLGIASEDTIKNSGSLDGSTIYEFKAAGAYTFYWTDESPNNRLSVAPVPTTGFGYYILLDQVGDGTAPSFSYAADHIVKMHTIDDRTSDQYKAYYSNFYIAENQFLAFRSYIANVDKYYTNGSLDTNNEISSAGSIHSACTLGDSTTQKHAIKVGTAGYYDIAVTHDDKIKILSPLSMNQFLTLEKATSSNDPSVIKGCKTAIVLDVSYTTNNPYATTLYVDAISSADSHLRVTAFFLASPGANAEAIYTNAVNYAYGGTPTWQACSNGKVSVNAGSMAAENASTSHSVFIVIDYNPDHVATVTTANGPRFVLRAAQA